MKPATKHDHEARGCQMSDVADETLPQGAAPLHATELPEDFDDATVPSWFARRPANDAATQEQAEDDAPMAPRFTSSYRPLTAQQQADAQDAYRRRLEERFRLAQQMAAAEAAAADLPEPDPMPQGFPRRPVPPRNFIHHTGQDSFHTSRSQASSPLGVSIPTALMLLSLASVIGASGGYLMANPGVATQMIPTAMASLWPFGESRDITVADAGPAPKKLADSAKVSVADVEGAVNAPIPLSIAAQPTEAGTPLTLKISGLPADAYITKGKQVAAGEWLVRAEDINAAELVVKSSTEPEIGLLVTALEAKSGVAAAPAKSMRVALNLDAVPAPGLEPPPPPETNAVIPELNIAPVNAPPEQAGPVAVPKPIPTPDSFLAEEVAGYVEKGDMLLKVGDIIAARQFYLRAHELKSPEGAYGVARTYDPAVFADLNVQGLKPDARKAAEWYGKAAAQGHEKAEAALAQPPM